MKKILSIAVVMAFGISFSFAQSATSNTTTSKEETQVATPVVKAVDVNSSAAKCAPVAGKSCCSSASKTSAITSGVGTETTTTEAAAAEKSCHAVSVGMSAAKPETTNVPVPEK